MTLLQKPSKHKGHDIVPAEGPRRGKGEGGRVSGPKEKPLSLILCVHRVLRVKDLFAVDSFMQEAVKLLPKVPVF